MQCSRIRVTSDPVASTPVASTTMTSIRKTPRWKQNSAQRKGSTVTAALWGVALTGMAVVVAGAVGIGQDRGDLPDLQSPVHLASAEKLSDTFRTVAKATFPGIVAIQTESKVSQVSNGSSREDMFGGDPRFEQFFRNMPELRRHFGDDQSFKSLPRNTRPRQHVQRGQGSGFVISKEGYIVTNNHVVSDADVVRVRLHDGREYRATVIGADPRSDVAVIKVDANDLEPVPTGDSEEVEIGDFVLAFGNPFGLEMTMTQGIISAKGRGPGINEREDYLQTDAAINPGNSGGPLVNLKGEVIGINTAISSRSGGYDGVGFAIPINMARWSVDQIIATGHVKRAYIGVHIQAVTSDLAEQLGLESNKGAIVTKVQPESPAAKSGLEPGDVIQKLNGQSVNGTRELQGIVEKLNVGKVYPLLIQRDGQSKELKITMAEMPDTFTVGNQLKEEAPDSAPEDANTASDETLGLQVQSLTPELAKQFGYSDKVAGVIISSVAADSTAEANGLQEGEVIEKVNQVRVTTADDFRKAMKNADLEKGVLMLVRQGELTRFLVVKAE